VADKFKRKSFI